MRSAVRHSLPLSRRSGSVEPVARRILVLEEAPAEAFEICRGRPGAPRGAQCTRGCARSDRHRRLRSNGVCGVRREVRGVHGEPAPDRRSRPRYAPRSASFGWPRADTRARSQTAQPPVELEKGWRRRGGAERESAKLLKSLARPTGIEPCYRRKRASTSSISLHGNPQDLR